MSADFRWQTIVPISISGSVPIRGSLFANVPPRQIDVAHFTVFHAMGDVISVNPYAHSVVFYNDGKRKGGTKHIVHRVVGRAAQAQLAA